MRESQAVDRLRDLAPTASAVWATESVAERVKAVLPSEQLLAQPDDELPTGISTLVVVGGGLLIDRAKFVSRNSGREMTLVAIPSIWGSGAEASPITVLNRGDHKEIEVHEKYLPDEVLYWPGLAESIPSCRARFACGDVWAHAIEGFLSPLSCGALRTKIATLVREMLEVPLGVDPRWFELSSRACAAQSQSSVGLVHGLAHTLECELSQHPSAHGWGHAELCSLLLAPVFRFNDTASQKQRELLCDYQLPAEELEGIFDQLFDESSFQALQPTLERVWPQVLRDPCTRTNCSLVRRNSLSVLTNFRSTSDVNSA